MNGRLSIYLAMASIVIATMAIGLSYYKTVGPLGPEGSQGPQGPPGQQGLQGSPGPQGPQGASFIVPGEGFKTVITNAKVGSDSKPVVTLNFTDGRGLPVSLGYVSEIRFMMAGVVVDATTGASQLRNYFTRTVKGSPYTFNGVTVQPALQSTNQPDRDSGGTFKEIGPGMYTYTFGKTLPPEYNPTVTTLIGVYASKNESIANTVYAFVPNGGQVNFPRMISSTETCNQCHDPLEAHGGVRQEYVLCLLCHTPDAFDPETGNSLDFKVMIHKIHTGANLPSVQAGAPYYIVGFGQNPADFSGVVWPQDTRNCETCHTGPDGAHYRNDLSRAACGSCHDNVDFETGQGHGGSLPQSNDLGCSSCHQSTMNEEFDDSIPGAHVIPAESAQLTGVNFKIISADDTGPGGSPVVVYTIKDDSGRVIQPSTMNSLSLTLAGPTTDYRYVWTEGNIGMNSTDLTNGSYSYTFKTSIPTNATGTYAIEIEGYKNQNIVGRNGTVVTVRQTGYNDVVYVAVTDQSPIPRRIVVSVDNCDSCHGVLALHGSLRKNTTYCVVCHNPTATDEEVRPQASLPPVTIDFKYMIHRIHLGEAQSPPYVVYGFRGSITNYSEVRYPGDLRDCTTCHVAGTNQLPLNEGVMPTTVTEMGSIVSVTPPATSVCTSCHDLRSTAGHAQIMTTASGIETCDVCHGTGNAFDVAAVHGGIAYSTNVLVNVGTGRP